LGEGAVNGGILSVKPGRGGWRGGVRRCVIAFPIAWWARHRWLADFAYRTAIGWWVFVEVRLQAAGFLVE